MSTPFYDLASMVVLPSGYKSGKIYAQKPLTTDGQLTFTRASTATRVNASGLIETVSSGVPRLDYLNSSCPRLLLEPQRTNLWINSEAAATWYALDVTATSNTQTSPSGTQSADTITSNTTNDFHGIGSDNIALTSGTKYTGSVFIKAGTGRYVQLLGGGGAFDQNSYANFDLQTGTITVQGSSATANIVNYGNGWYRCEVAATAVNTQNDRFYVAVITTANAARAQSHTTALSYYVWGAQTEAGAYATSYIPTTSAAVTRLADSGTTSIPSLVNASEGVLFLDYQPLNVSDAYPVDFQLQYNGSNSANGVTIYHDSATPSIAVRSGSSLIFGASLTATTAGTRNKIAIAYKGSDFAVYQNGVLKASQSSGAAPANLNEIRLSDGTRHFSINQALVFKTRLTNAQLAELTTL